MDNVPFRYLLQILLHNFPVFATLEPSTLSTLHPFNRDLVAETTSFLLFIKYLCVQYILINTGNIKWCL